MGVVVLVVREFWGAVVGALGSWDGCCHDVVRLGVDGAGAWLREGWEGCVYMWSWRTAGGCIWWLASRGLELGTVIPGEIFLFCMVVFSCLTI